MTNLVQPSRSELKFEIDSTKAAAIKCYLGSILRRDAHSCAYGTNGYPVCSVYLDNKDGLLCTQTVDGKRNRYKLRVRIYDDVPENPAFLEIKRRDGQVIKKQRATVDRKTATAILAGEVIGLSPSIGRFTKNEKQHGREWSAFREFCRLRDTISAVGTTYVSYLRDAYVSPDGLEWRATFDRSLEAHDYRIGDPISIPKVGTAASSADHVVFELKFTDKFPRWMQEVVRIFDLRAVSFPKYVNCVESLNRHAQATQRPRNGAAYEASAGQMG